MIKRAMKSDKTISIRLWGPVVVAAVLWFVMFSPWTAPRVNFWYTMTAAAVVLTTLATLSCRACVTTLRFTMGQVLAGVTIAAVLWGVFWVGDKVSQLMFSFARPEVDMIYGMKTGTDPVVVGLLLLLIIGPAEELFWRGFVQRSLSARWGANAAFAVTLVLYTAIHVWAFNLMLLLAALVVGGCWGLLYRLRPQALPALIVSHAVWDVCAFVLFPF